MALRHLAQRMLLNRSSSVFQSRTASSTHSLAFSSASIHGGSGALNGINPLLSPACLSRRHFNSHSLLSSPWIRSPSPVLRGFSSTSSKTTSGNGSSSVSGTGGEKVGSEGLGGLWETFKEPPASLKTLTFLALGFLGVKHARERVQRHMEVGEEGPMLSPSQMAALMKLPSRAGSRVMGSIAETEIPGLLLSPMISLWCWLYNADLSEAVGKSPSDYKTLGDFFARDLVDGVRQVSSEAPVVSPVDGTVFSLDIVSSDSLFQVKGVPYSLQRLVGEGVFEPEKRRVAVAIIYLAPGDYHGIHSPVSATVAERRHFPGPLLSVAHWLVRIAPGLFTLNERATLVGEWASGKFTMTAVGAYNVGGIQWLFDQSLVTNVPSMYRLPIDHTGRRVVTGEKLTVMDHDLLCWVRQWKGQDVKDISPGQKVGTFRLGSTVILAMEVPDGFQWNIKQGETVRMGQGIATILSGKEGQGA